VGTCAEFAGAGLAVLAGCDDPAVVMHLLYLRAIERVELQHEERGALPDSIRQHSDGIQTA
jgi:hypothetical protein